MLEPKPSSELPEADGREPSEIVGWISLPVVRNEDSEITCIGCGLHRCDYAVQVLGNGRNTWSGLHIQAGCGQRIVRRAEEVRKK